MTRSWTAGIKSSGRHRIVSGITIGKNGYREKNDFSFALFFGGQKIFFVASVIGFYRSKSQHITAQDLQALAKVQPLLRARRLLLQILGLLVSIGAYTSEGIERRCASC